MDDAKRELVRAWLIKARNDLVTAREIGALPDGPLGTAIYHCQQTAEKAVKGFLAFRDHRLERSHDVERLVELAAAVKNGNAEGTKHQSQNSHAEIPFLAGVVVSARRFCQRGC